MSANFGQFSMGNQSSETSEYHKHYPHEPRSNIVVGLFENKTMQTLNINKIKYLKQTTQTFYIKDYGSFNEKKNMHAMIIMQ